MVLLKNTKDRINYYRIDIYPTLFGDYLIQREYGAMHHKAPTNIIKEYAETHKGALLHILNLAVDKKNLGYLRVNKHGVY